jgi:hypothetical protein
MLTMLGLAMKRLEDYRTDESTCGRPTRKYERQNSLQKDATYKKRSSPRTRSLALIFSKEKWSIYRTIVSVGSGSYLAVTICEGRWL